MNSPLAKWVCSQHISYNLFLFSGPENEKMVELPVFAARHGAMAGKAADETASISNHGERHTAAPCCSVKYNISIHWQ
jgi:hypothetical protein